jgi:hypothetical protein
LVGIHVAYIGVSLPQVLLVSLVPPYLLDLLHKSEKGEAFADKSPDFTDKSRRKC